MSIRSILLTGLICLVGVCAAIASLARDSEPGQQPQDEVIRVTTNLVQVDAVVTDKIGHVVADLAADDFEILEDGQPQKISNFSYVSTRSSSTRSTPIANRNDAPNVIAPASRANVKRTIVFVVDDLGISLSGIELVRRALRTFVAEQMEPGDLVAIARTRAGTGALYKFTSDPRQLSANIDGIRWRCPNRVGTISMRPSPCAPLQNQYQGSVDQTIDSLTYIVKGLKLMPGRKAMVFFSGSFATQANPDDLQIGVTANKTLPSIDSMSGLPDTNQTKVNNSDLTTTKDLNHALVQLSNQASVVIYGVDTNGQVTINPRADESDQTVKGMTPDPLIGAIYGNPLMKRSELVLGTQLGLRELAESTGGKAVYNNNDVVGATKTIVDKLSGYYLIGYRPSEATFEQRNGRIKYHNITIRLKREGLTVRSRKGFYGVADEAHAPSPPKTREAEMIANLESPFAATEVRLRLTPLFANTIQGSFVRTLVHIDARDLTFVEQPDGWHQTTFDVLASAYGDDGVMADYLARTETIRARGRTYAKLLRYGLNYNLLVPMKKPGAYQMRAAVRDQATNRAGSAYQFIAVPDLKKGRLELSGIAVNSAVLNLSSLSSSSTVFEATSENDESQPTPAVRRFKAGMLLNYTYVIYNAVPDRTNGLPNVTAKVRIFRDADLIAEQADDPVDTSNLQVDPRQSEQ